MMLEKILVCWHCGVFSVDVNSQKSLLVLDHINIKINFAFLLSIVHVVSTQVQGVERRQMLGNGLGSRIPNPVATQIQRLERRQVLGNGLGSHIPKFPLWSYSQRLDTVAAYELEIRRASTQLDEIDRRQEPKHDTRYYIGNHVLEIHPCTKKKKKRVVNI